VSAAVLVETFQPGVSVEKYIRNPAPFNTQVPHLLRTCSGCYVVMTSCTPSACQSNKRFIK
jgi:hypothetical protein